MTFQNYRKQPYWTLRAYIPQKVLMLNYITFIMGNNVTGTIYWNYNIAVTLHILETICSRSLILNALYISDK